MNVKLASAHDIDCLCPPCLDDDMNAHILATGGQEALDRISNEMQLIGGGRVEAEATRFMAAGANCGNGRVRHLSPKQLKLILSLFATKDTTKVAILPGQTLDPAKVNTMGLPAGRALIDKLLNAPNRANVPVRMATEGQKNFFRTLNDQIQDPRCKIAESDINSITFAEVDEQLTLLKSIIKAEKEDAQRNAPAKKEITEGAYWYGDLIARVQRGRESKKLYVKLQTVKGGNEFVFSPGTIYKLKAEDMLSIDEMKAFAQKYGQCGDCGRKLTKQISIDRGIGPICSGKGYTL